MKLKKTSQKILDYIENVSSEVDTKIVASILKMSVETVQKNLRTLDDMNVIERVKRRHEPTICLVNSREDWQVYYASKLQGRVNNKTGANQHN